MKKDKFLKEKNFHNKLYNNWNRNVVSRFYSIAGKAYDFLRDYVYSNCKGKNVLEYGCGTGEEAFEVAKRGANSVTGIDISDSAIKKARNIGKELRNIDFKVMNAEATDFNENEFDLIFGRGILHHLDLKKAFLEIARILRPQGSAIFLEPLGHNSLINFYRKRTPHLRTEDEHPLRLKDIEMAKSFFQKIECYYFFLFSILASLRILKPFLNMFLTLDKMVFTIFPFLQKYAWIVVVILREPVKVEKKS